MEKKEKDRGRNGNIVVTVSFLTTTDIIPLHVHLSDTISDIKERLCDRLVEERRRTWAIEPELFKFAIPGRYLLNDNDPAKTLEQVMIESGFSKAEDDSNSESLDMSVGSTGDSADDSQDGYSTSNSSVDEKEAPKEGTFTLQVYPAEEEEDNYPEGKLRVYDEGLFDEDVTYPEEEMIVLDPEDAFSVKRPDDNILPTNAGSFHVFGDLLACRLTDQGLKQRYIPYDGFSYPLERVTKLTTTSSLVLIAFNSANLGVLEEFSLRTCSFSGILCLQLTWDNLFLRKLRQNLDPDVPIAAVTDLDVRHFDLLAFLDTPPCDLPELYGWDLSEDCADVGVQDIEHVNIMWLGIRPSDTVDASPHYSCFVNSSCKLPDDFNEVYDFLLAHPHLAKKTDWVKELQLISGHKLHRSLPYLWQGYHWHWSTTLPLCGKIIFLRR